jgi:predicted site-specific integrase-resolvase
MTFVMTSTEFAAKLGVNVRTLKRWLADGKIQEPSREIAIGKFRSRVWTEQDLKRALRFKAENYRKGRGRKPVRRKK